MFRQRNEYNHALTGMALAAMSQLPWLQMSCPHNHPTDTHVYLDALGKRRLRRADRYP